MPQIAASFGGNRGLINCSSSKEFNHSRGAAKLGTTSTGFRPCRGWFVLVSSPMAHAMGFRSFAAPRLNSELPKLCGTTRRG